MQAQAIEVIETSHDVAPAPQPPAPVTPMQLLTNAVERGADVAMLEKLMGLQERWEANQARKAFDEAMAAAKSEIGPIVKNRAVDYQNKNAYTRTSYKFEDLAQIAEQVNPVLSAHGLSYRYQTEQANGNVSVTCIISHRDGYSERNTLSAGYDRSGNKNDIQAIGSTVTYLQRYTLKAALGLAAAYDDDAQSAGRNEPDQPRRITDAQAQQVRDLIAETGADIEQFCTCYGIEAVPDLNPRDFRNAVQLLEKKKARANG
ncbi:ERF family protein [Breoghania sp. JC706]|uniref:ERF family protein n=1 Tax=Breoghania sp. JC706 TaxID=3117732 RepID=UPI003008B058